MANESAVGGWTPGGSSLHPLPNTTPIPAPKAEPRTVGPLPGQPGALGQAPGPPGISLSGLASDPSHHTTSPTPPTTPRPTDIRARRCSRTTRVLGAATACARPPSGSTTSAAAGARRRSARMSCARTCASGAWAGVVPRAARRARERRAAGRRGAATGGRSGELGERLGIRHVWTRRIGTWGLVRTEGERGCDPAGQEWKVTYNPKRATRIRVSAPARPRHPSDASLQTCILARRCKVTETSERWLAWAEIVTPHTPTAPATGAVPVWGMHRFAGAMPSSTPPTNHHLGP